MIVDFNPTSKEEAQGLMRNFILNRLYSPIDKDEPSLQSVKGSTPEMQKEFSRNWQDEFCKRYSFTITTCYSTPNGMTLINRLDKETNLITTTVTDSTYIKNFMRWAMSSPWFSYKVTLRVLGANTSSLTWDESYSPITLCAISMYVPQRR